MNKIYLYTPRTTHISHITIMSASYCRVHITYDDSDDDDDFHSDTEEAKCTCTGYRKISRIKFLYRFTVLPDLLKKVRGCCTECRQKPKKEDNNLCELCIHRHEWRAANNGLQWVEWE